MKDYFYGQTVPNEEDSTGERFDQFRVGALLAVLLMLLVGCATPKPAAEAVKLRVCYVKLMGQTEDGMLVEAQFCMSPEAYAETQK